MTVSSLLLKYSTLQIRDSYKTGKRKFYFNVIIVEITILSGDEKHWLQMIYQWNKSNLALVVGLIKSRSFRCYFEILNGKGIM